MSAAPAISLPSIPAEYSRHGDVGALSVTRNGHRKFACDGCGATDLPFIYGPGPDNSWLCAHCRKGTTPNSQAVS